MSEDVELSSEAYRGELLAHCYRMLGSVTDAEDQVQETLLRAWRAADQFDPDRASLRTWLHRIATNVCLTALEGRARRPLPAGLVGASADPAAPMLADHAVPWLQPFPERWTGDPAEAAASRDMLRLALIAALQLLPARQRAILILREVLEWPAADVAATLQTSVAAVNSGLQRARARLAAAAPDADAASAADSASTRAVVDRYVAAFERADVAGLAQLLAEDAVLEMPPVLNWYIGRDHYTEFMIRVFAMRGPHWRVTKTSANQQPALAAYVRGPDGTYEAHSLQVLEVSGAHVAHNVVFADPALFSLFDLPLTLPPGT